MSRVRGRFVRGLAVPCILVLALACASLPCAPTAVAEGGDAALGRALAGVLADPLLSNARVSALAVGADGTVLVAEGADDPVLPASVMKIVTAAAALEAAGGPDRELVTRLWSRGAVENGTLDGDLLVVGAGDPNISGRFHDGDPEAVFKEWAAALRRAGIRRVTGDLLLDDGLFDGPLRHESWPEDQMTGWYQAAVNALPLNDNCVDVTVAPGDGAPKVTLSPSVPHLDIDRKCPMTDARKRHLIAFWRTPGTERLLIKGRVWTGASPLTESVTVHDPTAFFGTVLHGVLAREGVAVAGRARTVAPETSWAARGTDPGRDGFTVRAEHRTSLDVTVDVALARSQNLYAECLLRHAARWSGRPTPDFDDGGAAALAVLRRLGVATDGVTVADGSGLSRDNRLTARAVVDLLRACADDDNADWGAAVRDGLPVSGESGSLRRRMGTEELKGRVRAKTGSLAGVSSLAGWVRTDGGDDVAFCLLFHDPRAAVWKMRRVQDRFCAVLAGAR